MMEFIYTIENKNTGKFYIGRTNKPDYRRRSHFSELRRGVHGNPRLQASFNKHGEEAFEFKVVDSAPSETIEEKELEWFLLFNCDKSILYNCHFETHGGPKVYKPHTPESAAKISKSIKDKTRKYIFSILDERYNGASLRYLANKYKVGANTLLDYTKEWEKLRNLRMPKSVQSKQTIKNVEVFVEDFLKYGKDVFRKIADYKLTRKSLKKYLPIFGLSFEQVLLRTK